jgi:hypothetical protein
MEHVCRGGEGRVYGVRTFGKPGHKWENYNNKMYHYETGNGSELDLFGSG